jgi:predicted transcriptional regulator
MVRYRIEPYPHDPGSVRIVARYFLAIVPQEVARRFDELARRARPRGWWQMRLLLALAKVGRAPASAAKIVRGRAAAYLGRYQRSLDAVMSRAGARYVPGKNGGRWSGYYEIAWDGE